MQRLKASFCLCLLWAVLSEPASAYAPYKGNVTAAVGPLIYKTNFKDSNTGAYSPFKGGLGLLVNGDISDVGALEVGMYHMNKVFSRDQGGKYITEETELVQINMGYRRYFSPIWSGSMTFYSSYSMGDPKTIHNDFTEATTLDTSARDTTEYGFDFSLQAEVWKNERWATIVNGTYSLSLTPKLGEKSDHSAVFIGMRYFIQGRLENPKD